MTTFHYCQRGVSQPIHKQCAILRETTPRLERSPQPRCNLRGKLGGPIARPPSQLNRRRDIPYLSLVPSIRCLTHYCHSATLPLCHSALSRSALSSWPSPFVVLAPSLRLRGHPLQPHHHPSCTTFTKRSETPSSPPSRVTVPPPPPSSSAFFLSPFSSSNTSCRICPFPTRISSCAPIPRRK